MNARTLFIGCLTGLLLPLSTFGQGAEEARELLMQMTVASKTPGENGDWSSAPAMQKVNPMNPDALRCGRQSLHIRALGIITGHSLTMQDFAEGKHIAMNSQKMEYLM